MYLLFLGLNTYCQDISFNLYFDTDLYAIAENHEVALKGIMDSIQSSDKIEIYIKGYADHRGSKEYNSRLSSNRANALAEYLTLTYPDRILKVHHSGEGEVERAELTSNDEALQPDRKVEILIKNLPPPVRLDTLFNTTTAPNGNFILQDLNFKPGRHVLVRESIPILKKLLKVLQDHPQLNIDIIGHVCCVDDGRPDGYDLDTKTHDLSVRRAHNIFNYLIINGIEKNRLTYDGKGFQEPLFFPELSEEHQQKNRRVEIRIVDPYDKSVN